MPNVKFLIGVFLFAGILAFSFDVAAAKGGGKDACKNVACDDGDPCTRDSCDPQRGCTSLPVEGCCQPGKVEACYTGPSGTLGVGLCQAGTRVCGSDFKYPATCEGEVLTASVDLCDGADNDCDGAIDERFLVGEACHLGLGLCRADGIIVCSPTGDGTVCNAVPHEPADEVCDGIDNDCDGETDEGFSLSEEKCDGIDNDCDGAVDEDFTALRSPCEVPGRCGGEGSYVCNEARDGVICNVQSGFDLAISEAGLSSLRGEICSLTGTQSVSKTFDIAKTKALEIPGMTKVVSAETIEKGSFLYFLGENLEGQTMLGSLDLAALGRGEKAEVVAGRFEGLPTVQGIKGIHLGPALFSLLIYNKVRIDIVTNPVPDGNGVIASQNILSFDSSPELQRIAVGDLNADGADDIVALIRLAPPAETTALPEEVPTHEIRAYLMNPAEPGLPLEKTMTTLRLENDQGGLLTAAALDTELAEISYFQKSLSGSAVHYHCLGSKEAWNCKAYESPEGMPLAYNKRAFLRPVMEKGGAFPEWKGRLVEEIVEWKLVESGEWASKTTSQKGELIYEEKGTFLGAEEWTSLALAPPKTAMAFLQPFQVPVEEALYGNIVVALSPASVGLARSDARGVRMLPAEEERYFGLVTDTFVDLNPAPVTFGNTGNGGGDDLILFFTRFYASGASRPVIYVFDNLNEPPLVTLQEVTPRLYHASAIDPAGDPVTISIVCHDSAGNDCSGLVRSTLRENFVEVRLETDIGQAKLVVPQLSLNAPLILDSVQEEEGVTSISWPVTLIAVATDSGANGSLAAKSEAALTIQASGSTAPLVTAPTGGEGSSGVVVSAEGEGETVFQAPGSEGETQPGSPVVEGPHVGGLPPPAGGAGGCTLLEGSGKSR